MTQMTFLGVYRESIFSPGKIREDAAILETTLAELSRRGYATELAEPKQLERLSGRPDVVLTMAQSGRALDVLEGWQKRGTRIINSVASIRNAYRKPLISLLAQARLPLPPGRILPVEEVDRSVCFNNRSSVYWLKRGDVHAVQPEDVAKVTSPDELTRALRHFRSQRIDEVLVQEQVNGEGIKFYGVGRNLYFRAFLASNGEEVTARMKALSILADRSADAVGLEIYGGDCILTKKGDIVLVDLNDWPSFSRCCRSAAENIAQYTIRVCKGGLNGLPGSD